MLGDGGRCEATSCIASRLQVAGLARPKVFAIHGQIHFAPMTGINRQLVQEIIHPLMKKQVSSSAKLLADIVTQKITGRVTQSCPIEKVGGCPLRSQQMPHLLEGILFLGGNNWACLKVEKSVKWVVSF